MSDWKGRASASTIRFLLAVSLAGCGARTGLPSYDRADGSHPGEGVCGNGLFDEEEQCEDGNVTDGDGCSSSCIWEAVAIACGGVSNCALGANGAVKCWGSNDDGNLGIGTTEDMGDEPEEMAANLPAVDLGADARVEAISVGSAACALLDGGTVKCWGRNVEGLLGLGDTNNRGDNVDELGNRLPSIALGANWKAVAIAAGDKINCAISSEGSAKCWGGNRYGKLGQGDTFARGDQPGEMGDDLPPIHFGANRSVRSIAVGGSMVCAQLRDGGVKCWGANEYGQLGIGELGTGERRNLGDDPGEMGDALPLVDLGTNRSALALAASTWHVCALLDNHTVKCWGLNNQGQLGVGDRVSRGAAPAEMGDALPAADLGTGWKPVELAAGGYHTCARSENGEIKCWGYNDFGQLGTGDMESRGDQPGGMGNSLGPVDLGTGRTARSVCAGDKWNCALLDNGRVKCWGSNGLGQLGLGDPTLGADRKGAVGNVAGEMGDNLRPVDLRF